MEAFIVQTDPTCDATVTKVLLVHDCDDEQAIGTNNAIISHLNGLGYSVTTIFLSNGMFKSVGDFTMAFQALVKSIKAEHVYTIVHYGLTGKKDICMYCNAVAPKNSLLLKQAFAVLYVALGREKCTVICPVRCCSFNTAQLPESQVGKMAVYHSVPKVGVATQMTLVSKGTEGVCKAGTEGQSESIPKEAEHKVDLVYPEHVWLELNKKLSDIRMTDAHKKETKHVRSSAFVEPAKPIVEEKPITANQMSDLICRACREAGPQFATAFARELGFSDMEWDEHRSRSGEQAIFLLVRRELLMQKDLAYQAFANALTVSSTALDTSVPEIVTVVSSLCRDFASGPLFFSAYPSLFTTGGGVEGEGEAPSMPVPPTGIWKEGVERPDVKEGTHLDKVRQQFIPPHLRDRMNGIVATADQVTAEKDWAEKVDKQYNDLRNRNTASSFPGLDGFAMTERAPTRAGGGAKPF